MTRLAAILSLLIASAVLTGCLPDSPANVDEQKDAHYLSGRNKVSSLDYNGAIQDFEKALENNPHSASAHFELALLYENQMKDYAAAIYHYERHLKFRPNSDYAEHARARIKSCKSDLVKTEILGPVTQQMQRDLERMTSENTLLKQRVENLEAQLSNRAVAIQAAPATTPQVQAPPPRVIAAAETRQTPTIAAPSTPSQRRTYVVKEGDMLTSIARQHGVELQKLLQTNPGVQPNKLRIGQVLTIP
jgi:LysM repeat protein